MTDTTTNDLATLRAAAYAAYNDHVRDMLRDPVYRAATSKEERAFERAIERLRYLSNSLAKYAHRWCLSADREPSDRMTRWVDEYNELRNENRAAWDEYCLRYGVDPSSDAYDCLA